MEGEGAEDDGGGGGGGDDSSQQQRWTCEACGCNTNTPTDTNCSICGTSNSGPSILRRAGVGQAARVGWFARGLNARRGMMNDDLGLDDEDLWESVVDGVEMAGDDPESAMESLAMEVSGMANAARSRLENSSRQGLESSRQRFLEAARAFSQANREAQRSDPQELLRCATENAASYQPRWANPSQQMSARLRGGNGVEVVEEGRQNLAHLPPGAGQGRAVRADEPLPRGDGFGSFSMSPPSNASQEQRQRRVFGFRVAFDHPTAEVTGSMGGCYLVGLTTSSFTGYNEQNGLQQSPFFWGIEDGGHKYEGSRYNQSARSSRRISSSNHAIKLGPQEARMNAHNVLFGSREVITVVCDFDSRTLTFWRDETLLGTLVSNLPRSGNLFPVVVPFNCGVTVAITGMDNDPIPLLRTFATDWRKIQQEKIDQLRQNLTTQRSELIENGKPATKLVEALKNIFLLYSEINMKELSDEQVFLEYTIAARLWYRCGMKLARLESLLSEKGSDCRKVSFEDFLGEIKKIVEEDDRGFKAKKSEDLNSLCEIGDRVELVEGHEKFGDAVKGPLHKGDRGTVVELQRGPGGERRSVRVIHNGRRWWYQPQALRSERSGLIESPGIWFLRGVLRAHGYDQHSLLPLLGNPVTSSSWNVGDIVVPNPKRPDSADRMLESNPMDSCIGRIINEPPSSSNSLPSSSCNADSVYVEFVDKAFAEICATRLSDSSSILESRRVRTGKLVHSSVFHGSRLQRRADAPMVDQPKQLSGDCKLPSTDADGAAPCKSYSVSDKVKSEIASLARLDRAAIETVTKQCKKNAKALAGLFSAGLPEAIISAIDVAERQMNSLEVREELSENISAIGWLTMFIADQVFSPNPVNVESTLRHDDNPDDKGSSSASRTGPPSRPRGASRRTSNAERRLLAREALARRDIRREEDSQGLVSSLQQRRSVLLSLMSRARRGSSGYLTEMMERGNSGLARELPLGQIPPHLGSGARGVQPFVFEPPGDLSQNGNWDDQGGFSGQNRTMEDSTDTADEEALSGFTSIRSSSKRPYSFLDSILRCRGDMNSLKRSGGAHALFAKQLINNCILTDSLTWTKASTEAQTKKCHLSSLQKLSTVIRGLVDEEGTPILQLAICFGCCDGVLSHLIASGAVVGEGEIRKAAMTNQSQALSLLLQNATFREDMIDPSKCSPAVLNAIAEAKVRQDQLDIQMRDAAGAFMIRLLRKLIRIGLSSRRRQSPRVDVCSRVISDLLVGNVLLHALQRAQANARDSQQNDDNNDDGPVAQDSTDRTGRFSLDFTHPELNLTSQGLLGSLPQNILGESLLSDSSHSTTFLLFVEDYLCSKDMGDGAAGLALLSALLAKFPGLQSWPELDRYGVSELVSFHKRIASERLDNTSRQLTHRCQPVSPAISSCTKDSAKCVIACPKGHTAVLHITRHSSFRCDLCGSGVERGRPMHGCRDCDWDACEDCTDKAESGVVKCTAILEIASTCQKLLSSDSCTNDKNSKPMCNFVENLITKDSKANLTAFIKRVRRRDFHAAKELSTMLDTPGLVTVQQFRDEILPAIHASLVGSSTESEGFCAEDRSTSGRRSKKARVVGNPYCESGDPSLDSKEERFAFCREVVQLLVLKPLHGTPDSSSKVTNVEVVADSYESPNDIEEDDGETDEAKDNDDYRENLYFSGGSELIRRLHQVLTFHEDVNLFHSSTKSETSTVMRPRGDLQALTKPIELQLSPSTFSETERMSPLSLKVYAEPLLPMSELEAHVLRTIRCNDSSYIAFCRRLYQERSIIVERPARNANGVWRIGQIVGFDEATGAHSIRYASRWKRGQDRQELRLTHGSLKGLAGIKYDGTETKLALAAREYFVLHRSTGVTQQEKQLNQQVSGANIEDVECSNILQQAIGTRVESNCEQASSWKTFTLIATDKVRSSSPQIDDRRFILVSDDGVYHYGVSSSQIRAHGRRPLDEELIHNAEMRTAPRRARDEGGVLNRTFPFLTARQRSELSRQDSELDPTDSQTTGALKRTWSALSLVEKMCPVELNLPEDKPEGLPDVKPSNNICWKCRLDESEFNLIADPELVEIPPKLCVKFSSHEKLPGIDLSTSSETTVICALKQLHLRHDSCEKPFSLKSTWKLFFSIGSGTSDVSAIITERNLWSLAEKKNAEFSAAEAFQVHSDLNHDSYSLPHQTVNRSRKFSERSVESDGYDCRTRFCDGLDDRCIQCMEVLSLLSEFAVDCSTPKDKDMLNSVVFANASLSKKLAEQLEDPIYVVGGAIPDWCTAAPSFSPRVFSYESRHSLLQLIAFGISRSTLEQQEAKVNVRRLRQRMASLRGRAVELVGEAFSGGAEDPTALQLQADELYGMEEALAARVRASFRAFKWQEHALQVAKVVVRRGKLLVDAAAVMERYTTDESVCRRRLEVRFNDESGFDASGNEAGVTRGFYADVAEALLSCENVAGIYCATSCTYHSPQVSASAKLKSIDIDDIQKEIPKLPLWIPDVDTSAQVVIPTPRADKRSGPGIYPRPLPHYHPQMPNVLQRFRFIGRLFASAMRDGFMFPLPLSSAFLKLVQYGTCVGSAQNASDIFTSARDNILVSEDLPRPGFLGGEVYAADLHICKALDLLDSEEPPLSSFELQRKYKDIAEDKNFARVAFGKSYDCSFEDIFQDRTFVDPLDPTQGEDAFPLCPGGHRKSVTIFNVREWVTLAKAFFLHKGVIPQALAFRRGVEDFFPADYLRLFTSDELQRDVCGVGDDVDNWDESSIGKLFKLDGGKGAAEALVAVAAMGGEGGASLSRRFAPSSPTIGFLIKTLVEAQPKQRRQFLSFVTSVPIVTPGRIEVVPIVSPSGEFIPMQDPGCLPRANTCSRRLYLPKFETYESFSQVLWAVVREESRFKGFYEWRGS